MTDIPKIMRAAQAAAVWHSGQVRKGSLREPYTTHLFKVAELVAEVTSDTDMICAAILHDAIEDQKIPVSTIAEMFGAEVAEMVAAMSDDKTKPREFNKEHQVETAPSLPPKVKILKLADKIANLMSLESDPPVGWPASRIIEYVTWAKRVVWAMGPPVLPVGMVAKFYYTAEAVLKKVNS